MGRTHGACGSSQGLLSEWRGDRPDLPSTLHWTDMIDRPHFKFSRRGYEPEEAAPTASEDAVAGAGPHQTGQDDPADPTDQVSGAVPPLENPVTGEPPVAPPIAPPVAPPARPDGPTPTDPVAPGEAPPPAPQPPIEPPSPGTPPADPDEPLP